MGVSRPVPKSARQERALEVRRGVLGAAQAETLDQVLVAGFVLRAGVVQELAALGHHLEKATAGVIIFLVSLEMFGQVFDPYRKTV